MTLTTKKRSLFRLSCLPFICAVYFPVLMLADAGHAGLTPMENNELEAVTGNAGFSIAIKDVQIFHHIDTFRYCASDNGYIEFQDFLMHGIGNPAKFNFDYDFGSVTDSGIIHYDVFETEVGSVNDWSGDPIEADDAIVRGMTSMIVPNWDQELGYTIGNLAFFDPNYASDPVDLGSLTMGLIDMPRFSTFTSPRIGGSGFDFQTSFQMTIDKIGYAWNTDCNELAFAPLYIGGSFSDLTGDDPRYPDSWKPNLASPVDFGEFQIGDLFGDTSSSNIDDYHSNPAMIDVAEGEIYGDGDVYGFVDLRLSMEGSIRFESADFNGTNFGPGAIDGLQVHRLDLKMIP